MAPFFDAGLYHFLSEEFSRRPLKEVPARAEIRYRLSELHELIRRAPYSPLCTLDLHPHWRAENLTNLIDLSPFNGHRVSEIYVRYGKSHQQIRSFGELGDPSVIPHVHISLGLNSRSFFSALVFNQEAWLDYQQIFIILNWCHEEKRVLMEGVTELGRAGYHLWGPGLYRPLSEFRTAEELRDALPSPTDIRGPDDKVGMSRDWGPNDPEIDVARIVQTSLVATRRLWWVFDAVALRQPPGSD